jgi:hypothetical protein
VVPLETIAASPEKYSGKEVVIAARVMRAEGFYVAMPTTDSAQSELMFVHLGDDADRSSGATETRLLQTLKERPSAIAVLRGRVMFALEPRYGHLNCCRFIFEVSEVLSSS